MHNINDQDGNVTKTAAPGPKRFEGLVARRVDNEEARYFEQVMENVAGHSGSLDDRLQRHIRGADLLRDAAGLVVLHFGAAQIVEDLCFARVDVA